jgi:hypothetical protein
MLTKAFENGRKHDFILHTIQADWRWLNRDVHNKYDAIICLGNSFTHLFSERDRRKVLAEFFAALKYDGLLILDQRNYDQILDHGFKSKHVYYYLNMYPLRRDYMRQLMCEVGFQQIHTFGDFKETYREEQPDFFVHVADKLYGNESWMDDKE